jgi:hypothetical protein
MERRNLLRAVVAIGIAVPALSRPVRAQPQPQRRTAMSNVNEMVVRYLTAWNEREPQKRRELVAKTWTEDGTYVDAARDGKGHDALDAMLARAQGHFPGYRLNLASGIEVHHDYLRFSWAAGGTADAPLFIKGTDFVILGGDGRMKSVVGFTDAAPARV